VNPLAGWVLAAAALWAGWHGWGWPGIVLAMTVIVFWLLLQFTRVMRVMRRAASAPLGHVDSAVMLNAKLKRGMALWQVVAMTHSLGRPLDQRDDRFAWTDAGGAEVRLEMRRGRLDSWQLVRPR
jgi:hypothetical protein